MACVGKISRYDDAVGEGGLTYIETTIGSFQGIVLESEKP